MIIDHAYRWLWALLFALAGLAIVRYYFLSLGQLIGLKFFVDGKISMGRAVKSATFWKMVLTALAMGGMGYWLAARVVRFPARKPADQPDEIEPAS